MDILLIHPPQAKTAEPPAGIPVLAGTLRKNGCQVSVCDMNIEGLSYLLNLKSEADDTWSTRAYKNRFRQCDHLRTTSTYLKPDKYKRAVHDINRVLENAGKTFDISLSLANFQHNRFSPLKSEDLLQYAAQYQKDPFFPLFSARLKAQIESESPRVVGISINYLSQALTSFAIAGFLRDNFPSIRIVAGGGLVTTWLQNPNRVAHFEELFDHLVSGPGEYQLLEILGKKVKKGRGCPDYSDFADEAYLSPGLVLPYATSTGCFWRKCSFCPETSEKNAYAPVPVNTVIHDIQKLVRIHQPSMIHFVDNALAPAILHSLIHEPPGVAWYGFVRFSHHLADPDFCHQLRRSGCVMLKLGLESGSQAVLDSMHKGIDLHVVEKALKTLKEAGIMTYVYLLFGTPAESAEEAEQTLDFVRLHHREITFLNLAIFNLPVCSEQIPDLVVNDFYDGDLTIYTDFQHPYDWGRKEIRKFLDKRFKQDPDIQRILKNDPPAFTSNHAPFFHGSLMERGKST